MIYIKSTHSVDDLANKHCERLSKKITYLETKNKTIAECKKRLKDPNEKEQVKRACALKVIIGKDLYSNLESIIKGNLEYLKKIKRDNPKFFLDESVIISKKNELDNLENSICLQQKIVDQNPDLAKKLALKQLKNAYKREYDDYTSIKNQLEKDLEKITSIKYKKGSKNVTVNLIQLLHYNNIYDNSSPLSEAKNGAWSANILCNLLGISVCPYCNRQYIFSAEKYEGGWISSAQLDHFLPKSCNPLFSCSFFNLIPSCYCCNHGKSDDIRETIYPYAQNADEDGFFLIVLSDDVPLEDIDFSNDIKVSIEANPGDNELQMKNSINVFHLKELYNKHQLELKDFIKRFNCCKTCRQQDYANVILDKNEWNDARKRDLILGLPLDAANIEYPLKKMKKDILKQLEEIEKIKL